MQDPIDGGERRRSIEGGQWLVHDGVEYLGGSRAGERSVSYEHFEEYGADGEQIGARIHGPTLSCSGDM